MAETIIESKDILDFSGVSDNARTYRILAVDSANELPSGDSISFNLIFKDNAGNVLFKRALKDENGNVITLSSIQDYVVLEYNFIDIEAVYTGDSVPADLKIYKF